MNITDDLDALVDILPVEVREKIRHKNVIEVVLDLGRPLEIRYSAKADYFDDIIITEQHISDITSKISEFGDDNRAGISNTLHRISAIRDRKGNIVGLTCRIGRAIEGTVDIIEDLIKSGKSILFMGRPGVGKTTKLRETSRVLANDLEKRVVIVDTSNEIAGDGIVPHRSVGRARRMQVPKVVLQHMVMIEAVENHMPEVIVIDEIGTVEEAEAARTIAERGVQLIATVHGNTLMNLISNPSLNNLVGGIVSVTLGDEEAKRRGTQKTVLERAALPTFDIVVEIQDRKKLVVYDNVEQVVDLYLRTGELTSEIREYGPNGQVRKTKVEPSMSLLDLAKRNVQAAKEDSMLVFSCGVDKHSLEKVLEQIDEPIFLTTDISEADVIFLLSTWKKASRVQEAAKQKDTPVLTVKSNSYFHIEKAVKQLLPEFA